MAAAGLWSHISGTMGVSQIKIPYRVEQSALVVLELRRYDGPFVEDGSRRLVQDVAAVVLYNDGGKLVERGAVKLQQGDETLVFAFSMLPPGGRLLVLEKSGKRYSSQSVNSCFGWAVAGETDSRIRTEEVGRTSLALTNITTEKVKEAWVYYKDYDPVQRLLVGGISYRVHISHLQPGYRATVAAFGYLSGNSMVIQ